MRAMALHNIGEKLLLTNLSIPQPEPNEVQLKVLACGVCRTDLHILENDLTPPAFPIVPGHQIVGTVEKTGSNIQNLKKGDFVGVPWLGETCHECHYCHENMENLCDQPVFTGFHKNGGFAEYCCANEEYCFKLNKDNDPVLVAPLLCAGLIGYRSLTKCDNPKRLGIYGYGSAAHILLQVALYKNMDVFVFTRPGDLEGQQTALSDGATWAGDSDKLPPEKLDAAIIFASVGSLVPMALKAVRKGGKIVCGGIHMSDIPSFPYNDLWNERTITSVANLTRNDGDEFLKLAAEVPVKTKTKVYSLEEANQALEDIRAGNLNGSAVLKISD